LIKEGPTDTFFSLRHHNTFVKNPLLHKDGSLLLKAANPHHNGSGLADDWQWLCPPFWQITESLWELYPGSVSRIREKGGQAPSGRSCNFLHPGVEISTISCFAIDLSVCLFAYLIKA
jgi:hypothetical protein